MTEDEARDWTAARFDQIVMDRLQRLVSTIATESERQNLIARSTQDTIWSRHIVDSLQLVTLGPEGDWLDIGSGAGFPGLVIAIAEPQRPMLLVEPRRLRADHLRNAAKALGLGNVSVEVAKVEGLHEKVTVISARAVARVAALFASASQCATKDTIWLLPKGRTAFDEVAEARRTWHGVFHVEPSITDPQSAIVIARNVRQR